jgi:predicted alpha/beta superfamily hydrolase
MLAGSYMGGLMTIYALVAYNQTFSMGDDLSPSIWAGGMRLVELIAKAGIAAPTRVYLDLGTAEIPEDQQYAYSAMFGLAGTLSLFGADVAARMVPGAEHNEAAWEKRIPVFMDYLLKPMYDADRE